jgi:uncharacterized protein
MHKTLLLAAAAALTGAALTTASADAQTPAHAMTPVPSIRVSATGEARAEPDQATLSFGVETQAATAEQAAAENASRMDRVIQALVRAGIPRERIQTSNYMVHPDYQHPGREGGEPRISGYRVTNMVTGTLHEVARTGPAIDAALAAGANRVHGVRFGFRDPASMRAGAIQEAIRRGRAEAQAIASGLGVQLGRVLDASTATVSSPVFPMMEMAQDARMMAAPTPVEPGEQTLSVTVHLVYAVVQ